MADKKSFVVYFGISEILDELNDEQVGRLFRSMVDYAATGTLPEFEDQQMRMAWIPIRQTLERDAGKYAEIIEKRRRAGAKGGKASAKARASKTVGNTGDSKQTQANEANQADNDNDNVNDNDNDNVIVNDNEGRGPDDRPTDGLFSFGVNHNVLLTDAERAEIRERYQDSGKLIDKVSVWLNKAEHPEQDHVQLIHTFAINDDWPKKPKPEPPPEPPDPNRGPFTPAPDFIKEKVKRYYNGL